MKQYLTLLTLGLLVSTLHAAQPLSDVSKADPRYNDIEKTLSRGLMEANSSKFRPTQAVSRAELASTSVALWDRIEAMSARKDDIEALNHLSQTYKKAYTELRDQMVSLENNYQRLLEEEKAHSQRLEEINSTLEVNLKKAEKDRTYLWTGIGVAALLGILAQ